MQLHLFKITPFYLSNTVIHSQIQCVQYLFIVVFFVSNYFCIEILYRNKRVSKAYRNNVEKID